MKTVKLLALSILFANMVSANIKPMNSLVSNNNTIIGFEENKGQVTGYDASKVTFVYKHKGTNLFLLKNGISYQFNKTHYPKGYSSLLKDKENEAMGKLAELRKKIRTETYRMDMILVGSNPNVEITTEGKSEDYTQYYSHNALNVHSYSKITYHNVYANIDWVIYNTEAGIKYDFVVRPGGNPSLIKLQTNWVEELKLNKDGSLTLHNRMGNITEQTPVSYQNEKKIKTNFLVNNNILSFKVNSYNPNQTIIIDPLVRVWGTYYGNSGDDYGMACSTDASGNVYLTGETNSTNNIASGGYQNTFGGSSADAFLIKFNSAGVRQWGTYYGGSNYEYGESCSVDGSGNIYMAGYTGSNANISSGGHQNTFGGFYDAFLVKFNSSGVRQWGTYYGDSGNDQAKSCSIDASGNVYLIGETTSTIGIASGGQQNTFGGGVSDAFLVKFNSSGVRQWGTYYGGSLVDLGTGCAVDGSGNIYLTGETNSTGNISSGGHQNAFGGSTRDAFLVKFNNLGVRQWGTYYGGSGYETSSGCAVDGTGNIYMAGSTTSNSDIASGGHQNAFGGGTTNDAFLVKFNSSGLRQWGTYYGAGSSLDNGNGCVVDIAGNVYLAGETTSTVNIASSGYQNTIGGTGNYDAFLAKFNSSGVRQWGTYYGGTESDYNFGCAINAVGDLYLTGMTESTGNIALGGHQNTFGGGTYDSFLVQFNDGTLCVPNSSSITASICSGSSYTLASQTYSVAGLYTATLTNVGGCDSTVSLNLTVNTLPTITVASGSVCSGSSFTFAPTGAVTYTYSSGSSVVAPVSTMGYTITGTDANGCVGSSTTTVNVTSTVTPVISISTPSTSLCSGSAAFTSTIANGGSGPIYHWRKNGGNVGSGLSTYSPTSLINGDIITCILTSNAVCASTQTVLSNSVTITINPTPTVTVVSSNTLLCNGQQAALTASGANSYNWSSGATTATIAVGPAINSTYTVTGTSAAGCNSTVAYTQSVSACTGLMELNNIQWSLFPNPTEGLVTVELGQKSELIIINSLGQVLHHKKVAEGRELINMDNQPSGIYFVKIVSDNRQQIIKLIKN